MFDFLQDVGNYNSRKVADKIEVNGLIVSTAYSSDEGYETAVIDREGIHPVERYTSKQEAIKGHEKWGKQARTLQKVEKLGWLDDFVESETIELKRFPIEGHAVTRKRMV